MIELFLLIKVGEIIGAGPTVALVIVTGILGASLARHQGFRVYRRVQQELDAGRIPAQELVDGVLILVGGVVLLTPGLLTDLCGFALLIPWVRNRLKGWLHGRFSRQSVRSKTHEEYIDI